MRPASANRSHLLPFRTVASECRSYTPSARGDCRFLIFDGAEGGHYRDSIVAVEKGDSEYGGGGCNALAVSGLGLLLVPLLVLMKR